MDEQTRSGYAPEFTADPPMEAFPPIPYPPQAALPVVPPRKQRRVGTFTLGLSLIMLGAIIPCGLFFGPGVWQLLKLAPLLLVFLGIETLIYNFRFKSDRLRYDGVSVFLVLLLTFVTLGGSLIAAPLSNALRYERQRDELRQELQILAEETLVRQGYVGSAYVDVSFDETGWKILSKEHLEPEDWRADVYMNLEVIPEGAEQSQVENAFHQLAGELSRRQEIQEISLSYREEDPEAYYDLRLHGSELRLLSPELVSRRIQVERDEEQEEPDELDGLDEPDEPDGWDDPEFSEDGAEF